MARYAWALLLARIYEVLPLLCPKCGGEMRLIAFITETAVVRDILAHLGEPTEPPRLAPARGPPLWERQDAGRGGFDPQAPPAPEYNFDQRIAWQGRQEGENRMGGFRPSWGDSCLWPPDRPTPASPAATGSDRGTIASVSPLLLGFV